ncbi:hypothetical protein GW17_00017187 [Ensete ventricosum]|nr:hypothetical protein GW17_00017187 [Ensete ventricosum]
MLEFASVGGELVQYLGVAHFHAAVIAVRRRRFSFLRVRNKAIDVKGCDVRVQLPEMVRMEELGEDVLSDAEQDEEWQWEEDSRYGYPCHPKAQQQVKELEDCEGGDLPEGNRFHERSMYPFQDPTEEAIQSDGDQRREETEPGRTGSVGLLVTPAGSDEQKQRPLPELVAGETVDGHVSEVTPEDGCGYHLDDGHGCNASTHEQGLQEVGHSLLVDPNRQVGVDVLLRIERSLGIVSAGAVAHDCVLQVLQFFIDRDALQGTKSPVKSH